MSNQKRKSRKKSSFLIAFCVLLISTFISAIIYGNVMLYWTYDEVVWFLRFSPYMFFIQFGTGMSSLIVATFLLSEPSQVAQRKKLRRFKWSIVYLFISSLILALFYGMVIFYIGEDTTITFLNLNVYRFFTLLGTGITTLILGLFVNGD